MRALSWLRHPGRPSSPPESSRPAGGRTDSHRRPASSHSSGLSAARAFAGVRHTGRGLRRGLAAGLLTLPLLPLLATGAAAQILPVIEFQATTYSVNENGNWVTLRVTKTGADSATVRWFDTGGTATRGRFSGEYAHESGSQNGTLRFSASQTERTLRFKINDDDVDEDDETFQVLLQNPSGTAWPLRAAANSYPKSKWACAMTAGMRRPDRVWSSAAASSGSIRGWGCRSTSRGAP